MDFSGLVSRLLGMGFTVHDYPKGGISSHAKRKNPVTPGMKNDADYLDRSRRSGETVPLYPFNSINFPNPKVT